MLVRYDDKQVIWEFWEGPEALQWRKVGRNDDKGGNGSAPSAELKTDIATDSFTEPSAAVRKVALCGENFDHLAVLDVQCAILRLYALRKNPNGPTPVRNSIGISSLSLFHTRTLTLSLSLSHSRPRSSTGASSPRRAQDHLLLPRARLRPTVPHFRIPQRPEARRHPPQGLHLRRGHQHGHQCALPPVPHQVPASGGHAPRLLYFHRLRSLQRTRGGYRRPGNRKQKAEDPHLAPHHVCTRLGMLSCFFLRPNASLGCIARNSSYNRDVPPHSTYNTSYQQTLFCSVTIDFTSKPPKAGVIAFDIKRAEWTGMLCSGSFPYKNEDAKDEIISLAMHPLVRPVQLFCLTSTGLVNVWCSTLVQDWATIEPGWKFYMENKRYIEREDDWDHWDEANKVDFHAEGGTCCKAAAVGQDENVEID